MLLNVLPVSIAQRLKNGEDVSLDVFSFVLRLILYNISMTAEASVHLEVYLWMIYEGIFHP